MTPAASEMPMIAADAVERHGAAAMGRALDHHRRADRMIDRREDAEREQRDGEHCERRRQRGSDQRDPAADIERDHHVAAAPAVGEPAGRQREQTEGDEGGGRERDELGIAAAVGEVQLDDYGRIDQHHEVIERMRPIEKADRQPPLRQQAGRPGGGKRLGRRNISRHWSIPDRERQTYSLAGSVHIPRFCRSARRRSLRCGRAVGERQRWRVANGEWGCGVPYSPFPIRYSRVYIRATGPSLASASGAI